MSDDVFAVRTSFQDVAELGQGYLERADGERMLLPLPVEVSAGEGVRFIVYLADGTPAFAGAGRAVQVSDQGPDVAGDDRYETLIDALVFDERSRPVYDYIVAVRQMAYADLGAAAEAEAVTGEEAVMESDEPTTHTEAASPALLAESMRADVQRSAADHDTASFRPDDAGIERIHELDERPISAPPSAAGSDYAEVTPADHNPSLMAFADEQTRADSKFPRNVDMSGPQDVVEPVQHRSIMPLPTGILRRPAIAVGWQPVAPKRPQPSQGSGMFRYPPGTLPIPARPPHPELRPDQRVQPAAAP